jgi:YNFM family putative membrane transporter
MTHKTHPREAAQQADSVDAAYRASLGRVLLLVGTALLVLTQLYAAIPLAAPVADQLGGNVTFALSTVYGLSYATGFLVWGPLADRYGNKRIMMIGLIALVLLTLACAFATSVPLLAVLRGLQGFAAASFPPTALAYLAAASSPRMRATAIGAVSTSFLISGILGQLYASAIAQSIGWAWVFITSSAALAILTIVIAITIKEPRTPGGDDSVLAQFLATLRLVGRPTILLLCAAHVTLLLSFVAMYTALGAHLTDLGLDASQTMVLRLVALPGMFSTLLVGPLPRRWSLAAIARAGVLIGAAGLLLEALLSATLVGTAAASLVFVAGISLAVSSMISLFGEASAPQRAGGMALNGFVLFLGASIGPLTSGLGLSFPVLLIVLAVLLVVAAVSLTGYSALRARPANQLPAQP